MEASHTQLTANTIMMKNTSDQINNKNNNSKGHNMAKICRVCGDKAIGFNFNGLTCESCKSFFRRNANKYSVSTSDNNNKMINIIIYQFD